MEEIAAQVTEKDLFYLEDADVALQIKQLQLHHHSGNALLVDTTHSKQAKSTQQATTEYQTPRKPDALFEDEIRKRLLEIEQGNMLSILYIRCLNEKNQELSGYVDVQQKMSAFRSFVQTAPTLTNNQISKHDKPFVQAPLSTIYPNANDLSYFCFNNNQVHGNDSANFQVLIDDTNELKFKYKRDNKIIKLNAGNRTVVKSNNFLQCVFYDYYLNRK